jgi:hypothetical protein
MHRTGVDGAGRRRRPGRFRLEEFFGLGFEALAATRAAEEIFLAPVLEAVLCGPSLDAHATNRIDRDTRFLIAAAMVAAATGGSPGRVMMAGVSRACAVCVRFLRHFISPGYLNNIP